MTYCGSVNAPMSTELSSATTGTITSFKGSTSGRRARPTAVIQHRHLASGAGVVFVLVEAFAQELDDRVTHRWCPFADRCGRPGLGAGTSESLPGARR